MQSVEQILSKLYTDENEAIIIYTMISEWLRNKRIFKLVKLFENIKKDEIEHVQELFKRASEIGIKLDCSIKRPTKEVSSIQQAFATAIDSEQVAIDGYRSAVTALRDSDDYTTVDVLKHILAEEEEHNTDLSDEVELFNKMGEQNYLAIKCNESTLNKSQLIYKALYEAKFSLYQAQDNAAKEQKEVQKEKPIQKQKEKQPEPVVVAYKKQQPAEETAKNPVHKKMSIDKIWQALLDEAKKESQDNFLEEDAKLLIKKLDDIAWDYTQKNRCPNIYVKFESVAPDILKFYFLQANKEFNAELSLNPKRKDRIYEHELLKKSEDIVNLWDLFLEQIDEA